MRATSLLPRSGAVNSSNWSTADFGLPRAHILSSSSTVSWIRGITTPTCFSWQVYFIWFVFLVGGGSPHQTNQRQGEWSALLFWSCVIAINCFSCLCLFPLAGGCLVWVFGKLLWPQGGLDCQVLAQNMGRWWTAGDFTRRTLPHLGPGHKDKSWK